jgi:hypothetical protein
VGPSQEIVKGPGNLPDVVSKADGPAGTAGLADRLDFPFLGRGRPGFLIDV